MAGPAGATGQGGGAIGATWRFVRRGYGWSSWLALAVLVSLAAFVGYRWSDLADANGRFDALLFGTWIFMGALLCWAPSARRDFVLLAVGLGGGATIEWWGTNSRVWHYFTDERPPPWIIPAWPIAALTIDRMARITARFLDERARGRAPAPASRVTAVYYVVVLAFVGWMSWFVWPTIDVTATRVVIGLMLLVTFVGPRPRRDLTLFGCGAALGVFLETWGTSRECWTYYTREVPPPVAVVAHGFAAIAFARVHEVADAVLGVLLKAVGIAARPRLEMGVSEDGTGESLG